MQRRVGYKREVFIIDVSSWIDMLGVKISYRNIEKIILQFESCETM